MRSTLDVLRGTGPWLGLFVSLVTVATLGAQRWQPAVGQLNDRWVYAGAYDLRRHRAVMYGGNTNLGWIVADTWEWDGQTWSEKRPPHSPGPLTGAMMAWDGQRVVLFGGWYHVPNGFNNPRVFSGATWAWDGQDWTRLFPKHSPPARAGAGFCYDPVRGRAVLFGGSASFYGPALGDLWEWDGTDWQAIPKSGLWPEPRKAPGLAFHPGTRRIVMIGGFNGLTVRNDTWQWDGKRWTRTRPAGSPWPPNPLMATDPTDGQVFLFWMWGTSNPFGPSFWRWDGRTWTRLRVDGLGLDRQKRAAPLIADQGHRNLLMFSGVGEPPKLRDTWAWDGRRWQRIHAQTWPSEGQGRTAFDARHDYQLLWLTPNVPERGNELWAYRPEEGMVRLRPKTMPPYWQMPFVVALGETGRTALFGGLDRRSRQVSMNEVWIFDGRDFVKRTYTGARPYLSGQVCFDPLRGKVLYVRYDRELWEWDEATGWRQLDPGGQARRTSAGVGFDPRRRRLVLFGGSDDFLGRESQDTWEWDGRAWRQMRPKTKPPARAGHFLGYSPQLGGLVLAGGSTYVNNRRFGFGDLWVWDGKDWRQVVPGNEAFPAHTLLRAIDITLDTARHRLFAYFPLVEGGLGKSIWQLDLRALSAPAPLLRVGQRSQLDLAFPGAAGGLALVALSGRTHPGIPLVRRPEGWTRHLPLATDALFQASLGWGMLSKIGVGGRAAQPFLIPNDPGLVGLQMYAAGIRLGPTLGIEDVTNSVRLEVVR